MSSRLTSDLTYLQQDIDKNDAELRKACAMNLERHKTVVEGMGQRALLSSLNATGEGAERSYQDHFENKVYKVHELEETIVSATPLNPLSDSAVAGAISKLGGAMRKTFIEEAKRNLHFYSTVLLTKSFPKTESSLGSTARSRRRPVGRGRKES